MAKHGARPRTTQGWTTALALLLILGATGWTYSALRLARVPSGSMLPTLWPGDVVTNRIDAYRHHMPRRGDIIIFREKESGDLFIKRVIAIPGEAITVWSGRVWIGGKRVWEPYAIGRLILERPITVVLKDDEVWVMGDNRDFSDDSRDFGPVKKSQIIGHAAAIIWPLKRRQHLPSIDAAVESKAVPPDGK